MIAISLIGWNVTIVVRGGLLPPIQSLSVAQLASNQVLYTERVVRLDGWLVPDSLLRSATCVYGFRLESGGATIRDPYYGKRPPEPDTFDDWSGYAGTGPR